ncbi:hypothetical protein [Helicobacter marmotae]|nr:hypothetical protein [Helicobacter marmotae]
MAESLVNLKEILHLLKEAQNDKLGRVAGKSKRDSSPPKGGSE